LLRLTIANVVEWTVDADERDPFKRSHQGSEVLKKRVTFVSFC
jgi:hypothetical protein